MNPFIQRMAINTREELMFRDKYIIKLSNNVERSSHTLITGVEGVGKSSLIETFFSPEYRIEMAKRGILITELKEFPQNIKKEEFYTFYCEMVGNAIEILRFCGQEKRTTYDVLKQFFQELRDGKEGEYSQNDFQTLMSFVKLSGFRTVIVVDNFERFLFSKEVTSDHHQTLLSTMETTQYIVVTNYDLSEHSLPREMSASQYLMRFTSSAAISVKGWNDKETTEYITKNLEEKGLSFPEECTEKIYQASGGVPFLVNEAAGYVYRCIKQGTGNEYDLDEVYRGKTVQTILAHWCKLFRQEDVDILSRMMAGDCHEGEMKRFLDRGITKHPMELTPFGIALENDEKYECCCGWLKKFIEEKDEMEKAMSTNPFLSIEKEDSQTETDSRDIENLVNAHIEKETEISQYMKRLSELIKNSQSYVQVDEKLTVARAELNNIREEIFEKKKQISRTNPALSVRLRERYKNLLWYQKL